MYDESLTFGGVLGDSIRQVGRHWIFFLVIGVASIALYLPLNLLVSHNLAARDLNTTLVLVYAIRMIHALLGCLFYGIVFDFAYQCLHRGQPSIRDAARTAVQRWPGLVCTMVVRYFWICLGLVLLVVPGVIWGYRQMLCWVVTTVEGISGPAALRRAQNLMQADPGVYSILVGHWLLCILVTVVPTTLISARTLPVPQELLTPILTCLGVINWVIFGVAYFAMVRVYSYLRQRLDAAAESDAVGFSPAFEL
ncbi:MAG: hypothetical protein J0I12_35305 [Candidatus Eremiobacteraeota bacterium]|nr:hypothetical protein [Candidatus Eremiobacteraeota bacterium]